MESLVYLRKILYFDIIFNIYEKFKQYVFVQANKKDFIIIKKKMTIALKIII